VVDVGRGADRLVEVVVSTVTPRSPSATDWAYVQMLRMTVQRSA
jgi:hypothetical protein